MRSRALFGVLVLVALAALTGSASADVSNICPAGSAAGQCKAPDAVAVDEETGEVYLADTGNFRVDVFDEEGGFLRAFGWDVIPSGAPGDTGTGLETCTEATGCKAGSAGSGAGQFNGSGPDAIAVDNDPASPSQHALYVVDQGNSRVQKFTTGGSFVWAVGGLNSPALVGVGPGGVLYVADSKGGAQNRVRKYNPDSSFIVEIPLPELNVNEVKALAVDRLSGDFYAVSRAVEGVQRYEADGTWLSEVDQFARALATDGEGHLFVADRTAPPEIGGSGLGGVYEYDSAGKPVRTFYGNGTLKGNVESLAPHSSPTGDVFVVEASSPRRLDQIAFPPPGPVVLPNAAQIGESPFAIGQADTKAQPVGSVRATFKTRVNPEGKATKAHFEYVDDATYQVSGFIGAKRAPEESAKDPSISPDSGIWRGNHEAVFNLACPDPQTELPEGKCLEAETEYHLRAVAENADGENIGPEATFETLPPIQLGPAWSTSVGSESAVLHAELNPNGIPTTARFEYVDDANYQKDKGEGGDGFPEATTTTTPDIDFGEGNATIANGTLLHQLTPGTTYFYRYVATDFFGEFPDPQVRSFTTLAGALPPKTDCPNQAFRAGASAPLPDCRAYELVSPLEKGNGDVLPTGKGSLQGIPAEQAARSGEAIAYVSSRAFGDAISSPFFPQYLARRDPASGWSTHSLNPPLEGGNLYEGVYGRPIYKGFSEDLCSGWLTQNTDVALAPGAPAEVPNLYRRSICGEDSYELLTTVAPPGFGREGQEGTDESKGGVGSKYVPGVGGWSGNGEMSVFKAAAALAPEARVVGVGKPLTCQVGDYTAEGAKRVFQWLRNGAPIALATAETYTTKAADEGKPIQCRMIATNEEDDANGGKVGAVAFSGPSQVVAPAPGTMPPIAPAFIPAPKASAPLTLGGAGGQTLSCDAREERWQGSPTFAYQWYRNGIAIAGAAEPTYAVTVANLEKAAAFQCAVTATNAGGSVTFAGANATTVEPGPEPPAPRPRVFVLDVYRVYAKEGGQLALVSVAPNGEAMRTHAAVGTRALGDHGASDGNATDSVAGAVSADGERIFFSATSKEPAQPIHQGQTAFAPEVIAEGESPLYLRIHPMASQSAVEETAGEFHCIEAANSCTIPISKGVARFIAADPEASRALYLEGKDLFEVDVSKAIAYEAGPSTEIAGEVLGVMGASQDASRAYLVSEEDCSAEPNSEEEEAQAGAPNLYLYEAGESCVAGEMSFVAELGKDDVIETADELSPIDREPYQRRSRVSFDGLHAAFVSRAPLTGYDNTDEVGGEPAAEVFLYDAAEGKLRCASCNPGGGRPRGGNVGTALEPVWVAGQIPGWATQWHPSRALSEDGNRLFFESFEGLVPRDTNGRQDIYEWEEAHGKAECEAVGAERYVANSEGCLSLISAGTSPTDSTFIDASANGSDVFFHTASSLVGTDYGLIDIYDARVGGGFPEQPPPPVECEGGEACQSPPAPPVLQTPSSATFDGEGDVPPKRACPKGKRRVRRAGKTLCIKKPHKAKKHRRNGRRSRR